jgi:hypothetical protein
MSNTLVAGLVATTLALLAQPANASISVMSYEMQDGANLHGAYYDNQYNGAHSAGGYLSGGTGDLTDGVLSADVSAGYGAWAPYVLWDGASPVLIFDLGAVYELSSMATYFKYYGQAAVYMPASMGLRFSDDGVHFGPAQLRSLTAAERNPGGDNSNAAFELLSSNASGRYIELTLNNGPENRWLALGEVVFDGVPGGTPLSVPEPGSASLALLALVGLGLARAKKSS